MIVHDAARPLVTPDWSRRALAALDGGRRRGDRRRAGDRHGQGGGATASCAGTLDRSALWAVQTPQVFRRAALERALAQPDDVLAAATDDASLVEARGGTVRVVARPAQPQGHDAATTSRRRAAAARALGSFA